MSFHLKDGEPVPDGIRRIVRGEIDTALELLGERSTGDRDEIVHDARKSFKKIRAVLRLVRPDFGERAYQRENACFRVAGKPLTQVRDAVVLVKTFDDLAESLADEASQAGLRKARRALLADDEKVHRRVLDEQRAFADVAVRIASARERLDEWSLEDDWYGLRAGMKQTYERGRQAFEQAGAERTVGSLHEWRKQAKYLWHQIQVLEPICSTLLGPLADRTHDLGDALGDDHDLAMLRQTLEEDRGQFGGSAVVSPLLKAIERRRGELQQKGLELGGQLYHDKPRVFVDRLTPYWRAWRAHKALIPA